MSDAGFRGENSRFQSTASCSRGLFGSRASHLLPMVSALTTWSKPREIERATKQHVGVKQTAVFTIHHLLPLVYDFSIERLYGYTLLSCLNSKPWTEILNLGPWKRKTMSGALSTQPSSMLSAPNRKRHLGPLNHLAACSTRFHLGSITSPQTLTYIAIIVANKWVRWTLVR